MKRVIQAESGGQGLPGNRTNIALDNQGLETQSNKTDPKEGERKMSRSLEEAIQALRREMETMFEEAYIADQELKKASEETTTNLEDAWKFIWDRCHPQREWKELPKDQVWLVD